MRVAIFTETFLPKIDGIVRVVCTTVENLRRRGVEVLIVAPDQGTREYLGARVVGVPCVRNPVYPEGRLGLATPLTYRAVRAFRPDLIHVFHPALIGMAGVLFAKQMKIPLLTSFHLDLAHMLTFYKMHLLGAILKKTIRWGFNQSDYALAPSKLIQKQMVADGIHNVGLWRRGVNANLFHPRFCDAETRAAISDGHPEETILLYAGRLAPEKQIEQLRPVLERVPRTRLALVGDGPHRAALEAHFAGLPATFLGFRTGESLARVYASADMFVFPSAFESFGLVMLEAMAAGIPVVASRVGGAGDMIVEGETGYSFPVDDVEGLVVSVQNIVNSPEKLPQMKAAARVMGERFAWETIMDELLEGYEALVRGEKPAL
ncbi:MAG TPA: glycosyltransferase family 1 protein [Aggregatilineales bacterium]|nr:glycosyltransferase family 1 protein [Anaerolineales bacterium]HRE46241.1 glycosyltransferase family 1 protein [Aggregatilineales bacterium]